MEQDIQKEAGMFNMNSYLSFLLYYLPSCFITEKIYSTIKDVKTDKYRYKIIKKYFINNNLI